MRFYEAQSHLLGFSKAFPNRNRLLDVSEVNWDSKIEYFSIRFRPIKQKPAPNGAGFSENASLPEARRSFYPIKSSVALSVAATPVSNTPDNIAYSEPPACSEITNVESALPSLVLSN